MSLASHICNYILALHISTCESLLRYQYPAAVERVKGLHRNPFLHTEILRGQQEGLLGFLREQNAPSQQFPESRRHSLLHQCSTWNFCHTHRTSEAAEADETYRLHQCNAIWRFCLQASPGVHPPCQPDIQPSSALHQKMSPCRSRAVDGISNMLRRAGLCRNRYPATEPSPAWSFQS
jgi:hypothetical protein